MKSHLISYRSTRVAVLVASAVALWGSSPRAAAAPPQMQIFKRRPPAPQRTPAVLFGSVVRSQYAASRAGGTQYIAPAPQPGITNTQPNIQPSPTVIVRPPVYASVAPTASRAASIDANGNSANRSRLVLPVLPQGAPQVPAAPSTEPISPAPAHVSIAPAKSEPQTVRKAEPVWPPAPDQADYGRPVFGRPGFVHPPGLFSDDTVVVDVRGFAPGQKVRDPRNGSVFLVPPF